MRKTHLKKLAAVAALLLTACAASPAFAAGPAFKGTGSTGPIYLASSLVEDPDLNPYMEAAGIIGFVDTQNNKIVINDIAYKLAANVVYKSVPPGVVTKSSFRAGKKAGFRKNSKGEISVLYLLLK